MADEQLLQGLDEILTREAWQADVIVLLDGPRPARSGTLLQGTHVHDGWECIVPLAGRMLRCAPGVPDRVVHPGQVALMPPHCVHTAYDHPRLKQARRLRYFGLTLDHDKTYVGHIARNRGLVAQHYLSEEEQETLSTYLMTSPADFLLRLAQAQADTVDERDTYTRALLQLLFSAIRRVLARGLLPDLTPTEWAVQQALNMMHRHYADPDLCLGRMAEAVGLSRTYFATLFREVHGKPVHQTLIELRMERAQDLLRSGCFSIKEVAALTGWKSQLYFSTAFRRRFGFPPSQLRRGPGPQHA